MIENIKIQRQQEISNGEHLSTFPPLYVVYDIIETCSEHNSDYTNSTSFKYNEDEYRRYNNESGWIKAEENTGNWDDIIYVDDVEYNEVLKTSFHDKFITCTFTRVAAEDFIQREKHNLNNPYIFVHHIPYRNIQLIEIGIMFGD